MLDKNERHELSELVLGLHGLAPEMGYHLWIDPAKWARAKAIMDKELHRAFAGEAVDRDVVYTMYLLNYTIQRQKLDERTATWELACQIEDWYDENCSALPSDDFWQDWSPEVIEAGLAKEAAENAGQEGGDAE